MGKKKEAKPTEIAIALSEAQARELRTLDEAIGQLRDRRDAMASGIVLARYDGECSINLEDRDGETVLVVYPDPEEEDEKER